MGICAEEHARLGQWELGVLDSVHLAGQARLPLSCSLGVNSEAAGWRTVSEADVVRQLGCFGRVMSTDCLLTPICPNEKFRTAAKAWRSSRALTVRGPTPHELHDSGLVNDSGLRLIQLWKAAQLKSFSSKIKPTKSDYGYSVLTAVQSRTHLNTRSKRESLNFTPRWNTHLQFFIVKHW